jgi:hypothetical protein
MYTRWAGATGRYQGKCEQGHCALTGDQATSKHEGEILTLLKYVIGHGRGDVKVPGGRRQFRLNMVFNPPSGLGLVAEYDGAYWHGGRNQEERQRYEERDYYKARNPVKRLPTPLPGPDSRPLCVRGHRNTTPYSATR